MPARTFPLPQTRQERGKTGSSRGRVGLFPGRSRIPLSQEMVLGFALAALTALVRVACRLPDGVATVFQRSAPDAGRKVVHHLADFFEGVRIDGRGRSIVSGGGTGSD